MNWKTALCPVVFGLASVAFGQSIGQQQALRDLGGSTVVMDLSAHPDDEDGSSLAMYRMMHGARTYSVLFTRGEGGQNEKGPELYEQLGVLRSEETRAAGRILGTEVVFLNFPDFGFSKTATETFRFWGGQTEVLRRLVYVIRKYKPDVLFTNHNTIDGHGNHQVVAIAAIAAFDAAADSTMFPEQFRESGIQPWQPKKLFFRGFGHMDGKPDVSNDIQALDPLRQEAYIDIASRALHEHRTQGMDHANLRGFIRGRGAYKLVRANSPFETDTTSFLSGLGFQQDDPLVRVRELTSRLQLEPVPEGLAEAAHIQTIIDSLSASTERGGRDHRVLSWWRDALQRWILDAAGVSAHVSLDDSVVVAGSRVDGEVELESPRATISSVRWSYALPEQWVASDRRDAAPEMSSRRYIAHFTIAVGSNAQPTLPRETMQYHSLDNTQSMTAVCSLLLDGNPLTLMFPIAFDVAPAQVMVLTTPTVGFVAGGLEKTTSLHWNVTSWLPEAVHSSVSASLPPGWICKPQPLSLKEKGTRVDGDIVITPPDGVKDGIYPVAVRTTTTQAAGTIDVFHVAVRPGIRVVLIESYDNTLAAAIAKLGLQCTMLSDSLISNGIFQGLDVILVDIRAYMVREPLKTANTRLLEFVRNGGTMIVMYQKEQEWKPEFAPYPFTISRQRVTDEDAPITMLAPGHPLLSTPNRITPSDWNGWKQERGLYFPSDVPSEYVRLLSSQDPEETALTTGYLAASYGKGIYVYSSYVWYRQLKEANPGAYRCFANMLSYHAGSSAGTSR